MSPILFLIFNRPDTTSRVFDAIRLAKPTRLYVAADGPRLNKGERAVCEETRAVVRQIDWECEVKTLFRDDNLGCRKAVSSAIDWFFENEEQGIILEDDCLPDPSFFDYCADLLQRYKDNDKIFLISGDNFLFNKIKIEDDYYFSKIPHIWGWASWRRAWEKYDVEMKDWAENKKKGIFDQMFPCKIFQKAWAKIFDKVAAGEIDTWDYQWTYAIFKNGGYCINPRVNLISNIGFEGQATHTTKYSKFANMETAALELTNHPMEIVINSEADNYVLRNNFGISAWEPVKALIRPIYNLLKKLVK